MGGQPKLKPIPSSENLEEVATSSDGSDEKSTTNGIEVKKILLNSNKVNSSKKVFSSSDSFLLLKQSSMKVSNNHRP